MIYLIDDTPVQMLEGFLNPSEYSDVLKRLDSIPLDDVPTLSGASCVLMHSSYADPSVKRRVQQICDYGGSTPLVLFSDGDKETAEFNGQTYIISIKKSVLYSRLSRFLKDFRKKGRINLGILAGETPEPKKIEPVQKNTVFAELFSKVSLDFAPEKEDNLDAPRIYCIGRDGMNAIASKVGGFYVKAAANELQGTNERTRDIKIHDFLMSTVEREASAFLLDTDADHGLFMQLAMHIRLSATLPGQSSLAPIVFISDSPLEKLIKKSSYSQIFITEGTYICHRGDIKAVVDSVQPLDESSFRIGFLDKINIPAPKGSNHSLANQWGASRLYMLIRGADAGLDDFKDFQDIHKRLYFKYVCHRIPSGGAVGKRAEMSCQLKRSVGKRILLIDDEAGKGWTKALSCLMPFATLDVISETVLDFDEFSERAKQAIIEGHYDLVLLDLRLGGIKEDFIVDPEQMSGYKVLQIIKQCNRGTQVIMLTASNKAWNLKALMSGATGADGYFVKESPEYEFSDELSRANLRSLLSDMEHCLEQRYLVEFWSFVRSLEQVESELAGEIRTQLEIAYEMAARAVKQEDYSYAFLALYQVVEIVTSALTDWTIDTSDKNSKLLYLPREKSYSKELVVPSDTEVLWRLKPLALERIGVNGIFPQKKKLAALYLQAWEKEDRGILFLMDQLIAIRNAFIHPDNSKLFETKTAINEGQFSMNAYFKDEKYIFGTTSFKTLFREACTKGLLFVDSGGRPVLHRDVIKSQTGIKFMYECLKEILPMVKL